MFLHQKYFVFQSLQPKKRDLSRTPYSCGGIGRSFRNSGPIPLKRAIIAPIKSTLCCKVNKPNRSGKDFPEKFTRINMGNEKGTTNQFTCLDPFN